MKLMCIVTLALAFPSCEQFLAERNTNMVTNINSLQDMQALLDATNRINSGNYSGLIEIATDDFFLGTNGFLNAPETNRAIYSWKNNYLFEFDDVIAHWRSPFHIISLMNTILDELPLVEENAGLDRNHIKGSALFHRAFTYHNLVQIYCKSYDPTTAQVDLGLPLRLNSDVNDLPSTRSSLEEIYGTIENDLKGAIELLPINSEYQTRPSKTSAHALLSRVYLLMQRYTEALEQADLSLAIHDTLLDFNELDASLALPIEVMNKETIFYASASGASILNPTRECYIDTVLYDSYCTNDLRKSVFFQAEDNGYFSFRGSYTGQRSAGIFVGLSVAELLLIKAEVLARNGNIHASLETLNTLLERRYKKEKFKPKLVDGRDDLLTLVLEERRKELIFRGVRWSDLKRLNQDPRYAKTLYRRVPGNEQVYELPPNDPRYVFLIPQEVIERTGMKQNPR